MRLLGGLCRSLTMSAPLQFHRHSADIVLTDCWQREAIRNMEERDWDTVRTAISRSVAEGLPLPGDEQVPVWPSALPEYDVMTAPEPRREREPRQTWALVIAYNGDCFSSFTWEKDSPEQTVVGCLQAALQALLIGEFPVLVSAGRTDAGVSAVGQCISFYTRKRLNSGLLETTINSAKPGELRLCSATPVSRSFHATFSACWRRYVYLLPLCSSDTFTAKQLNNLFAPLVGSSLDYSALGRGLPRNNNGVTCMRYVRASNVQLAQRDGGALPAMRIDVLGDRFLRRQIRTLVATAFFVAQTSPDDCQALFNRVTSAEQEQTAPAAPATGLCFAQAGYGEVL